jgi:hypothetical protein
MALHQATCVAAYDAAGSILIGILMAAGVVLISRNGRYLAGETLAAKQSGRGLASVRANPEVERVVHRTRPTLLMAGVQIAGEQTQAELAVALRELERRIMMHRQVGLAMILTLATADDKDMAGEPRFCGDAEVTLAVTLTTPKRSACKPRMSLVTKLGA